MILKNLTKNYTTIPNELITDNLSHGAFRLYCYLASKPETWEVYNNDIKKQLNIGRDGLAKYWKELIEAGWVEKKAKKGENGKFTGKTILILNNSKNIDKTESSETPISAFDGKRDKTESSETRKHSNTKPISKTNNIKNNKKEPIKEKDITKTSTKEENSQLVEEKRKSIKRLMSLIRDFYKEKNLSLNGGKVFKYEKTFFDLLKNYSLEDIEEVIKFGMKDKFYSKLITIPSSLFNNFESMKLAYEEQEEPHFKSALDFYEINLPEGWIL